MTNPKPVSPDFSDLSKPETFVNHVRELTTPLTQSSHNQILKIATQQSLFVALIMIGCIFLFERIYEKIVQPVISLSKLALRISRKDYSFTIKKPSGKELGGLYETLNSLKEVLSREENLKKQLEITNKKLKKINEAKAEFLAKSSHDIKNLS